MMLGKRRRLSRIFKSKHVFIAALDHGVGLGFVKGLEDPISIISLLSHYVDAFIINRGIIKVLDDEISKRVGIIYKLNGITSYYENPFDLRLIGDIEEALSYDADAVSYEMYIGGPQEARQLEEAATIISKASKWDIPVILHIYPHGEKMDPIMVSHCIRLGYELGADIVKTYYFKGMRDYVDRVKIPVIVAGGPKMNEPTEVINYVKNAISEGASGVALGRNLWGWDINTVRSLADSIKQILNT